MGFIVLAVLLLIFIFHFAYTIRFQRAIILAGRRISESSGGCVSDELIYILTPKNQIMRNIINYILIVAIFILGTVIYSWYMASILLIFSLCILSPLVATLFPKPDDPRYLKGIRERLFKLLRNCRSNGYASVERQIYLEEIISGLSEPETKRGYVSGTAK